MTHTTPGPRKIATTYGQALEGRFDIVPWATQRQRICRIAARPDYPRAHAAADARLIAAAPEMLQILQAFVKAVEMFDGLSASDVRWWAAEARTAIAKTTEAQ